MCGMRREQLLVKVLGLDISTHCGAVLLDGDQVLYSGVAHYKPMANRFDRWALYKQWLATLLESHDVTLASIEGYGFSNSHTLATLVELGTVLRMCAVEMGVSYIEVAPTSLKKFSTGKGNARKNQMMLAVYKRWGFETVDDNIADAYALARMGQAQLGVDLGMPKASMEALKNVTFN